MKSILENCQKYVLCTHTHIKLKLRVALINMLFWDIYSQDEFNCPVFYYFD